MADTQTGKNSQPTDGSGGQPGRAQFIRQYIKDFSFENPNVDRMISGPGENPNLAVNVGVNARKVGDGIYESVTDLKVHATVKGGTLFDLEIVYAGLFKIENIPEEALEPFLLINCPTLTFPFVRRLVADISREGGMPPLLLDPIDFGEMFARRREAAAQSAEKN